MGVLVRCMQFPDIVAPILGWALNGAIAIVDAEDLPVKLGGVHFSQAAKFLLGGASLLR